MKFTKNPKIVIAGSVNSTLRTLGKLIEHKCNVVGVLGLRPDKSSNVSGYVDLRPFAEKHNIPFQYFAKINDEETYAFIKDMSIDLFFVIGLSQMVREPMLSVAKFGLVGFHPTKLPEGRGRGAVAWMILGKVQGAATFFLIDEGMDSGPILGQREFKIGKDDYAEDIINKIKLKIDDVLDDILPKLNDGKLSLTAQDNKTASYLGQRKPKDGLIDWNQPAELIYKLIRATSKPLPGAYVIVANKKLIIYRALVEKNTLFVGVPGRVLLVENTRILVACQEGAIWLDDYDNDSLIEFKIGLDLN